MVAGSSNAAKKRAAKAAVLSTQAEKAIVETVVEQVPQAVSQPVTQEPEEFAPIVLEAEVCPAGKHQGETFKQVLEDVAFCTWICKEPRRGWMGLLKAYLETEHDYEQPPAEEVAPEMTEEEAEQAAKVAAARAKLLAKGAAKGQPKKKPAPPVAAATQLPIWRPRFEPTTEWQELLPEHICPKGLQFRMDMAAGKSYARLPPGGF